MGDITLGEMYRKSNASIIGKVFRCVGDGEVRNVVGIDEIASVKYIQFYREGTMVGRRLDMSLDNVLMGKTND